MKSNRDFYDEITQFCKDNPNWFTSGAEKRVLKNTARIMFDPARLVKTRKVNSETVKLIKECKERGFRLYILSNWDSESGKMLVDKYPDIFSMFDGIVFSGDVKCAKPEPAIFECVTQTIPAEQCIIIDDQPENIAAARKLGFNTILVNRENTQPNIAAVREQLQGVVPFAGMHT